MAKSEQSDIDQMHSNLFGSLVTMLAASAMQQMGKLVHPLTGKPEIDLDSAQITIDMLSMLQAKTRGNVSREEELLLNSSISTLQLTFVESSQSPAADKRAAGPAAQPPPPSKQEPATDDKPDAETAQPEKATDDKQPKFHKAYDS